MTGEREYWLAWSQIAGIGPVLLKRVYQTFGSLAEAWTVSKRDLGAVEGLGTRLLENIVEVRSQINPSELFAKHQQKNPHFWTFIDPEYPALLREIPSPPPILYYRGIVNAQENLGKVPMVGIVGTRSPTAHGRKWTQKLSQSLAQHGFTVVSGMAAGIDGEAHSASLKAGGRTIAVLGTGVDYIYPAMHRHLYEQIQQQGLIISEYPAGTTPERSNFPARNRLIAGLCRAILVIEAPQKSGALITARYANEFNRDVYSLPNSPDVLESIGCLKLLDEGAGVIIEEQKLLEMLGAMPTLDEPKQLSLFDSVSESQTNQISNPPVHNLEPRLSAILELVTKEAISFDAIVQRAAIPSGEVSATLLELELLGLVTQLPGMRYQREI